MRDPAPAATRLKDYAPPAFRIETVELQVEIFEDHALVRSRLAVSRRPGAPPSPLVLDGEELELESVALDGRALASGEYALGAEHLTVAQVPERFTLDTLCRIRPGKNTKLMGLYAAESGFFTQCEAQGFRRITYFLDRPDVMAKYTVTIYVDPGKLDQCGFAMQALKRAMKWDEETFGLEVDLGHYSIVAVGDFNAGAMENKGLNLFNTRYVLARPDTATDADFLAVDRVVAHEYFHNWTGNRVTCRDWFQLSLKEGLTVFREQEFGADLYSRAVERIREVRHLRTAQFAEDAGPMAHPVRPGSYLEISNFYTTTVYEKGAEVVRMIRTLIGAENFRKGMELYFARHDGQAVTCDDFVRAMADAARAELSQFMRWYDQAGTPVLGVKGEYDASAKRYALTVKQSCPPTPGQDVKLPFHIPFAVGLVGPDGRDMLREGTRVLSVREPEQRFVFENIGLSFDQAPVPSLLRDFSAPVIVKYDYTEVELIHLMAHDTDAFNRWDAGQRLALGIILRGVEALRSGGKAGVPKDFFDAFGRLLAGAAKDPAFAAEALALPSEGYIAEQMEGA